ncbi:phage major tail protein, TP901-1 family [Streptococcus salivarius]|jgi:TP901-1 family phage major tail protein|uniref:phage major tail protein, TP901-1 family n=1 Tax=Streptococcus salivarius TaxID=1304 RepID=UPI00205A2E49|nr:MAG TPA: major tail protein [Caudoviricetes sp.]
MAETKVKEAQLGKEKILMFRKFGDKTAAAKLALQTEHEWEYSRDADTTKTKDGAVVADGGLETKLSITAIGTKDELNEMLKKSVVDGYKVEVWEIDLSDKKSNGKYGALYAIGRLSSWKVPANVEELVEIESEMSVEGKPQAGEATLTDEQVKEIQYTFQDTTAINSL